MTKNQILYALLFSLFGVCFAQNPGNNQSDLNRHLKQVIDNISKSKSPSKISRATLDTLVNLYCQYDKLRSQGLETAFPGDNGLQSTYSAFNNLAVAAKRDTLFIRVLINLESCIRTSAELSESMPCFVQSAIKANLVGFLKMYQSMNQAARNELKSSLDWPCDELDLKKVFNDAVPHIKDKQLKVLAVQIADSLHANGEK